MAWTGIAIHYIELQKTNDKSYIASEKLGYMEEKLPLNSFTRIHKLFIIALDKISSYNADQVVLNNKTLPLGRLFKAGFLKIVRDKSQVN